jgi:Uma2 family endonuclease
MLEIMAAKTYKTMADLAMLGEETHVELIRGELVPKASPTVEHNRVETGLVVWLHRRFSRPSGGRWPGGWWIYPEIHVGYEQHEIYCHDVMGWRRERSPEPPTGWPIKLRPDWVCEVLSRGHERRDRVEKLATMYAAGVPHYWLVNHEEKLVQVFRHDTSGFLLVGSFGGGELVRAEPFESIELSTSVIFGDIPDEE